MRHPDPENSILHAIGHVIGIQDLSFDEEGLCALELVEEFPVALKNDAHSHRILIIAEIGRVENPEPDFLKSIAGWNLERITRICPWLAWDAEESRLVLGEEIAHSESLDLAEKKFEAFMESLLECRGFLEGRDAPADSQTTVVDWIQRC